MLQWIISFSCNMVFMMMWYWISRTQSRRFTGFQNTRKFWFDLIGFVTIPAILNILAYLARHSRSHRCFQFLASILNGFFEFLVLRVNEINSSWSSGIIEFRFFIGPFFPLLQLGISSQFLYIALAMNDLAWMLPAVLSVSPWTIYIFLEVLLLIERTEGRNLSKNQRNLLTHRYSNSHRCGVRA